MKLDGKEKIAPTPFDAHEKVVRNTHTHSADEGYKLAEHEYREYPKVVDIDEDGDPVTVASKEEEEKYKAEKAAAAKKVKTA